MKYNKSSIMARAWAIWRAMNEKNFSKALRSAWAEAKSTVSTVISELVGSAKQIAWATDIRNRIFYFIDNGVEEYVNHEKRREEDKDYLRNIFSKLRQMLASCESASMIIEVYGGFEKFAYHYLAGMRLYGILTKRFLYEGEPEESIIPEV